MKYQYKMTGVLATVFLAAAVFAVTDEEIAKMRAAMPEEPFVAPQKPRTMLVFNLSKGFGHSSIPYWAKALDIMAEKTGAFTVEHSEDMAVFTTESLSRFDAVCFNNTTKLVFDEDQKAALMEFITQGKGIVGIHAATDNFYGWPEAAMMMGGIFQGHPWGASGTWAIKLDDPDHPMLQMFEGQGFKISDEIYRTNAPYYSRDRQRVLMSLDMSDPDTAGTEGVTAEDKDTGISWIKSAGQGRLFYCSLGHNHHLTWTPSILAHYLAGIQYALGDFKVDDAPLGEAAMIQSLIDAVKGYDWGQSRAHLTQLEELIRRAAGDAERLAQIETLMQPLLSAETTLAAKDFACRQLSVFGTERSVPALAKLLEDPQTEHLARIALQRIPSDVAETALLDVLSKTADASTKIGIMTSLGMRRSTAAVGALSRAAVSFDAASAGAAAAALGMIASSDAADVLKRVAKSPIPQIRTAALDALAVCADRMTADGRTADAAAIYELLYAADNPSMTRVAGLVGLSRTRPAQFAEMLPEAMFSDDAAIQAAAIRQTALVEDDAALKAVLSKMEQLSPSAKVILLTALAANASPLGRDAATAALTDDAAAVRLAACFALGQIGGDAAVMPLAQAAARASERNEKDAARAALYQLKGDNVNAAIKTAVSDTFKTADQQAVAVELIRAIGQRGADSLNFLLFETARSDNAPIAQESLRSLQLTAGPADMPAMAQLLAFRPTAAAENTAVIAAEKISQRDQHAAALINEWERLETSAAKAAYLRVMGRLGDVHAISILEQMYRSSDGELKDAAFRAMTDWPSDEFIAFMKQEFTDSKDAVRQVLAFRAYVRMIAQNAALSGDQKVQALSEAMTLMDRPAEQRLVLSALAAFGTAEALSIAQKAAANPELKAEAQTAILSICGRRIPIEPDTAKAALAQVLQTAATDAIKEQTQSLLAKADFILDWEVAGPYRQRGSNEIALFDVVFAPEKNPGQVKWKPIPPSQDSEKFWYVDLLKAIGGDNRVAYARTVLISDTETDALLELGSDDGIKVWLNGQLVHGNNVSRGAAVAQDKVPVRLKKGENTVLLKITQGSGDWGFCMRAANTDGSSMMGLCVKKSAD